MVRPLEASLLTSLARHADADPLQGARNDRHFNAVIKDGKVVDLNALPTAPLISTKTKS